tara:strand:- start:326 stop:472 length:147 start_codon:yes stop_codon:yes gene_type:complete
MKESWFSDWLDIDVVEKKEKKKEKKNENNNGDSIPNTGKPNTNGTRLL